MRSIVGDLTGGDRGIGQLVTVAQLMALAALSSIPAFTTPGIGVMTLFGPGLLELRPSQRTR